MRYIAKETLNYYRTGTLLCRGYYEQCRLSIRAFCSIVFYVAIVNWKIKVCIIIIIIIFIFYFFYFFLNPWTSQEYIKKG